MKEIWKDIKGYDGYYQISNFGIVKSLNRTIIYKDGRRWNVKERILQPNIGTNGYYYVNLSINNKQRTKYIHRLAGETFLMPLHNKEIDHIDENKLNNNINNLRWITHFKNSSRSNKNKYRRKPPFLENNPKAKKVYCFKDNCIIKIYKCAKQISIDYNINYSTLRRKLQKDTLKINDLKYSYNGIKNNS